MAMDTQRSAGSRRARVRLAALSQLALLCLTACPGGDGLPDGGSCHAEAACPPNQRCEEGVCVPVSTLSCPGPDHASGEPNLLDNPGFECAHEGSWRTAFSVITRETSGARTGTGSIILRPATGEPSESFPPSAWSLTEVQVEKSGTYCSEIWMQGEVADGARIGVRRTDAFGGVIEDSLVGFPFTDAWERLPSPTYSRGALVTEAKAGDRLMLRVFFPKPKPGDHLRLDDAMLRFSPVGDCRR